MSENDTTVMTEQMHVAARTMLATMQVGTERKRRILELRARRDRLHAEWAASIEALAVEEAEQVEEGKLIREMWDQWRSDVRRGKPVSVSRPDTTGDE